jgi:hypothetical protein
MCTKIEIFSWGKRSGEVQGRGRVSCVLITNPPARNPLRKNSSSFPKDFGNKEGLPLGIGPLQEFPLLDKSYQETWEDRYSKYLHFPWTMAGPVRVFVQKGTARGGRSKRYGDYALAGEHHVGMPPPRSGWWWHPKLKSWCCIEDDEIALFDPAGSLPFLDTPEPEKDSSSSLNDLVLARGLFLEAPRVHIRSRLVEGEVI